MFALLAQHMHERFEGGAHECELCQSVDLSTLQSQLSASRSPGVAFLFCFFYFFLAFFFFLTLSASFQQSRFYLQLQSCCQQTSGVSAAPRAAPPTACSTAFHRTVQRKYAQPGSEKQKRCTSLLTEIKLPQTFRAEYR